MNLRIAGALVSVPLTLLPAQPQTAAPIAVQVPATANPYLAGMPVGTRSTFGDRAPAQSPVLVEVSLAGAAAVTFTATGAANHFPVCPPECDPPEGSEFTVHRKAAENGISDIRAPMNAPPEGSKATIHGAVGTVCLDAQSRSTSSCLGPEGAGKAAGAGFLLPDKPAGALVSRTVAGKTSFSVNGRGGAFQNHQGYFEFDVTIR